MQSTYASIESLAAIVQEKDRKLTAALSEYEDLTKQFEIHYALIVQRDSTIQQLQLQLESSANELQASESRARITTQLITRSSDRLTSLEKRIEELKLRLHDLNGEILTIQFETEKLRESKPVITCPVDECEIRALREALTDAERRKSMTLELVSDVKNESELTLDSLKDQHDSQRMEVESKLKTFQGRRNEFLAAIRGIERQTRERIDQIDISRRELEESFESKGGTETEISELKTDLRGIDLEVSALEQQAEEERGAEEQRRSILQTIKQKLDERSQITDGDLTQAEAILETQKRENAKLVSQLHTWNEKVEKLATEIGALESGMTRKPDILLILESEKGKLNKLFRKKARKQLKAQKRLDEEQQRIESQIRQQTQATDELAAGVSRCVQEARKRAEFAHSEKKKIKAALLEIAQLEGERTALKEKEQNKGRVFELPPPKPQQQAKTIVKSPRKTTNVNIEEVDALTSQLERYNADVTDAQTEMEQLKREADDIQNQMQRWAVENGQLEKEAAGYDGVKKYLETLRATAKPQQVVQQPAKGRAKKP
jgi:chromosome segregation ATPase